MEPETQPTEKAQQISKDDLLQAFRLNRMKQMKLERMTRYNIKLKEELKQDRIKTSNCALMVIDYMEKHEDKLLPEIWGETQENRYKTITSKKMSYNNKGNNNYSKNNDNSNGGAGGCCTIM